MLTNLVSVWYNTYINWKKEIQMIDYAMFTEEGNAMVNAIVTAAIDMERDYDYVMDKLEILQETEAYSECLDTEVRETVYEVMRNHEEYTK